MKPVRIIPKIDVKGPNLVKGIHLEGLRVLGDPEEFANYYYLNGADELIYQDVVASLYGRNNLVEIVRRTSKNIFIPLTVGGGIRNLVDIKTILRAGADKVSVNTAALTSSQLISEASDRFGIQCIVVAIDARRIVDESRYMISIECTDQGDVSLNSDSKWEVFTHGGRTATGIDVVKWAQKAVALGAGEILLTSMDEDGREAGYDLELLRSVSEAVTVPVIASGGAGNLEHLSEALCQGKADAVLAASIFHFGTYTVAEAKKYLNSRGIPVRLIEVERTDK